MHSWKLILLSLIMSCSTTQQNSSRSVAKVSSHQSLVSAAQIYEMTDAITHSYLLGQDLLNKFDEALDKDPSSVMDTEVYSELQAVRMVVDEQEEKFELIQSGLSQIADDSSYTNEEKTVAEEKLAILENFVKGEEVPEQLQHLVLGNLREKKSGFKKVDNYKVDRNLLQRTLRKLENKESFQAFKKKIKNTGKQIKNLVKRHRQDRSTSSDTIIASAGPSGNITGRGFPANTWALTYDDGPGAKTSSTVIQNLKNRNMKATFFMLAKQVEALPTIARSITEAGMDIASHSYDHPQLTKLGPVALEKQVGGAKKIIETKLGKTIKLFRLPYGAGVSVSSIRTKIADHNMIHVFWNVDTLDWQDKNPTSILNRAVKQMNAATNKGGVILFHDIHHQSVTASAMLMDYFTKEKINVCTVQGVVDQINKGLASCQ